MYKSIMNKSKLRAQISGLEENWVLVRCLALQKFLTIYAVDLYMIWHFMSFPIWLLMKFSDRFLMCQEPGSVEFNIVSAVIVSKRKSIWDFFLYKKIVFSLKIFFCRYFKIILTCRYHKYWLLDDGNKSESGHVLTVFVIFLEYLQIKFTHKK